MNNLAISLHVVDFFLDSDRLKKASPLAAVDGIYRAIRQPSNAFGKIAVTRAHIQASVRSRESRKLQKLRG